MKLGVCVPYRNREEHLHTFIPKVGKYLKDKGINFHMYFCHQVDNKLFNRGATKNIAAKYAFEDGCDYIVWHDIDMIPDTDGGADYSYPANAPRHIATKISQMDYELKYHEYFGGAVLFSKEQVDATNGYSNNYWDWGMEDDDLFWRCHEEKFTNDTYLLNNINQSYLHFNGSTDYAKIPYKKELRGLTSRSHTISVLCRSFQQPEKNPIFLIGNKDVQYIEYPILRIPGYDYGISFNNSRALSLTYWNNFNHHNYMWIKRYDNQWSWVTAVFDVERKASHFYLNGTEVDSKAGHGSTSPHIYSGKLKNYGQQSIYLGTSPSILENIPFKFFKGDIAKIHIWNTKLDSDQVKDLHINLPKENLVVDIDINKGLGELENLGAKLTKDIIDIPNSITPHRIEGKFTCLPHLDEGLVDGKWAKGETTAANERRYVLQMQQGKINYKEDGIKQVKFKLVGEKILTPWAKMIDVEL